MTLFHRTPPDHCTPPARPALVPLLVAAVGAGLGAGLGAACTGPDGTPAAASLDQARFDTVAAIGVLDGPPEQVFGTLTQVAVSAGGWLAVLDGQSPALTVFDDQGGFVASHTSQGEGPGDLRQPQALIWRGDELLVLDFGRVSIFRVDEGRIRFVEQRPARFLALDLCVSGDAVFLGGYSADGVIHELGDSGERVRTLAPPPVPAGTEELEGALLEIAMADLGSPWLRCDLVPDRILEVGIFHPGIRLHRTDGRLVWVAEVGNHFAYYPEVVNGGGLGIRIPEETGAHLARSVVPWDEGRVLVQYERRRLGPRPEGQDFHGLDSRLIRLDTGEEEERTEALPLFMDAAGERFFHVRQQPFPQVLVLERRPGS